MGNYNPHAPFIVGNEWVPIVQSNYQPDENTERGYTMYLDQDTVIVSGSNSVSAVTSTRSINKVFMNAVYAAGTEDQTGPIRQVIIPVDQVIVTGSGPVGTVTNFLTPSDNSDAFFADTDTSQFDGFGLSFDTSSYSNELTGKRILNVELLYVAYGTPSDLAFISVGLARAATAGGSFLQTFVYQNGLDGPTTALTTEIQSISLTDVNPFWNTALALQASRERFPWRYNELALLDASSTPLNTKLNISIFWNSTLPMVDDVFLKYAALRVTYCEEKRLLYGSRDVINQENVPGVWLSRLLNTSFQNGATTLPPGAYTVTTTFRSLTSNARNQFGNPEDPFTPPTLNALRQLYELPTIPGVQINRSLTLNDTFTQEASDVLPHTVVFTAASTVTGSHAYGTQNGAPVYGSITATQDVNMLNGTPNASNGTFTQVRFYARRFGVSSGSLHIDDGFGFFADISSQDFDALDEIIDGWKEVTLTLNAGLTSSSAAKAWVWSAPGATAATQWQILSADGPSMAGNFASGIASYTPPAGTSLELTWKQPNQASSTLDTNSDATLIISQGGLPVSSFAVTGCSMALAPAVNDCGVRASCIPTAILGNGLSWDVGTILDDFERESSSTWTTTTTGEAWSHFGAGGSVLNAQFTVADGVGKMLVPQANAARVSYLSAESISNVDVTVSFRTSAPVISGAGIEPCGILLRGTSLSDFYLARAEVNTSNQYTIKLYSPTDVTLASVVMYHVQYEYNRWMRMRAQIADSIFRAKIWYADEDEPNDWHVSSIDATTLTAGWIGVSSGIASGNLNAPLTFEFDDLCAIPAELGDGLLEIQRSDEVDDFQTILLAPPCILPSFCDFEARVGTSTYRMRTLDPLGFAGDWTDELSIELAAPGVSGVGTGPGTLIFTSNRSAEASLAHSIVWDRAVNEQFDFAEAGFQELRTQYGRDFFVAFRPTERGGEQFTRTILVNAAAIAIPSLGNFRSLRDLAWDQLPYICVRDELGNRWYANVAVPRGDVKRNRRLYLANVVITEVTDTPAPYTGD